MFDVEIIMGTHYQGNEIEIAALDTYIKLSRAAETTGSLINEHLKTYDLTISQFGVLEALFHLGPMQSGQLGEKILKTSGNMTLVIDNLVKLGFVHRERREDDRRCVDILLTDRGKVLVEEILPIHVQRIVDVFSVLSLEEQAQLGVLCRKLGRDAGPHKKISLKFNQSQ